MQNYTELTKAQKILFDDMRSGKVLKYDIQTHDFLLTDKEVTSKMKWRTAYILLNRGYIHQCYEDAFYRQYCVNIEVKNVPQIKGVN
jgi:hypothetical protein